LYGEHKQLSISISSATRHKAVDWGLKINSAGWIRVHDLLTHKNFMGLVESTLDHIVASNGKQRFQFGRNAQKVRFIRAVQGHTIKSVDSDLLLEKIENPFEYSEVIHGTYLEPIPFILEGGLNRMARNHVHMCLGYPGQVISGMRASAEVIVEVNMVAAIHNNIPFYVSANDVLLTEGTKGVEGFKDGSIPPRYLRSIVDFRKMTYISEAPIDFAIVCSLAKTDGEKGKKLK